MFSDFDSKAFGSLKVLALCSHNPVVARLANRSESSGADYPRASRGLAEITADDDASAAAKLASHAGRFLMYFKRCRIQKMKPPEGARKSIAFPPSDLKAGTLLAR